MMPSAARIRLMSWVPVVDNACCCCSLETCNKLQGFLSAIGSFIVMVACAGFWMNLDCSLHIPGTEESCKPASILTGVFYFLNYGILEFVTSIIFLIGIFQSKPGMMTPFIVQQFICVIVLIQSWMMLAGHPEISPEIVTLLVVVPLIALHIYFLVCANSLRVKMEYSQNGISQDLMNE